MTHRQTSWALRVAVACVGLALCPGVARAGEAVKLLVELPPDVPVLAPGDSVPLQVVGEDAAGNRSAFGSRKVVFSVGSGRVEVVERPYRYSYRAPETIASAQTIRIEAHLQETPAIQGFTTVRLAPAGRYVRLLVRPAATTVELGGETTVEVLAEKREGGTTPVVDRRVHLAASGGGSVEFLRLGHYRFRAPTRAQGGRPGQSVTLTAGLDERPDVKGEVVLTLGGRGGSQPAGSQPGGANTGQPAPPESSGEPDSAPADGTPGAPAPGITWPSGTIRVAVWRLREAGGKWSPGVKRMPEPGGEFVARAPFQKLRVVVERRDATKVELEWWIGDRDGATVRRDGPGEEGDLTLVRSSDGRQIAHLVGRTPDDHRPLNIDLLITLTSGEILRERIVMRRRPD